MCLATLKLHMRVGYVLCSYRLEWLRRILEWPRRILGWPRRLEWPRRFLEWPRRFLEWPRRFLEWPRKLLEWLYRDPLPLPNVPPRPHPSQLALASVGNEPSRKLHLKVLLPRFVFL